MDRLSVLPSASAARSSCPASAGVQALMSDETSSLRFSYCLGTLTLRRGLTFR